MTRTSAPGNRVIFQSHQLRSIRRIRAEKRTARFLQAAFDDYYAMRRQNLAVYANELVGNRVASHGFFEEELLAAVFDLLDHLGLPLATSDALDIGANIGNHTVYFARHFRHVTAFEPNPRVFRLLDINTDGAANMKAHNLALGRAAGQIEVFENFRNLGATSRSAHSNARSVLIDVVRLDDLDLNTSDVRFIKIDVEGMEADVLEGAAGLIAANRPIIMFEENATAIDADGSTDAIRFLRARDYAILHLEKMEKSLTTFGEVVRHLKNRMRLQKDIGAKFVLSERLPVRNHHALIGVPAETEALRTD